ncbi:MAG: hypothetical protein EOP05_01230 [Proteobacteria bacterium]|nr:MAG: hypothetical protein EOP05_01230 [Pseudomonadota bacterium]
MAVHDVDHQDLNIYKRIPTAGNVTTHQTLLASSDYISETSKDKVRQLPPLRGLDVRWFIRRRLNFDSRLLRLL